jgi:hypothetical protein
MATDGSPIDVSVLEALIELRKQQAQVDQFCQRAEERKDKVEAAVFSRVMADYGKRRADLEAQAAPLVTRALVEYRKLRASFDAVRATQAAARLDKEEVEFRHALVDVFLNRHPLSRLTGVWANDPKLVDATSLVTFAENHDLPRLRGMGVSYEAIKQVLAILMTARGVPCVYYGQEQDLFHPQDPGGLAPPRRHRAVRAGPAEDGAARLDRRGRGPVRDRPGEPFHQGLLRADRGVTDALHHSCSCVLRKIVSWGAERSSSGRPFV